MKQEPSTAVSPHYGRLLADIKARVHAAQIRAGLAANRELLVLYWDIGRMILDRQKAEGWGAKVIDRLSRDLQNEFPGRQGFSPRNLKYMRAFAEAWPETVIVQQPAAQLAGPGKAIMHPPEAKSAMVQAPFAQSSRTVAAIVQQPAAQIPWTHHCLLLDKLSSSKDRLWYAAKALENGWSRPILALQIESGLHTRQGKALTNFKATLPPPQSDLAQQITKDPYVFDFLNLRDAANERAVEDALMAHVEKFLLELGVGFALVGRQVHMEVGDQDFYLDLLFYHLKLRCFVVVDLKARDFTPEAAGKMNFYLSAVDDRFRQSSDQPSIGLILCRAKNRIIAEYALRDLHKPIGVSDYVTRLVESLPKELQASVPSVKEIESGLAPAAEPSPATEAQETMSHSVKPFALKDAPALIERLLPVQKLSAEAYKEQMAGTGKTLTALGSYWKGRKPLILNKACILGCLLPATENPRRDLETYEKLMAMDDESFVARWPRRPKPREILAAISIARITDYFVSDPPMLLPQSAPVEWSKPELEGVKVEWRADISELERRQLEAQMLPRDPYRERVETANRPEEVMDTVHTHVRDAVNVHLGTSAHSFPELVEQLGILRFGHRPRVADTFCGSGQIPFEAARLGCDVYASDLNPVACMLTWGAFNIVGGSPDSRVELECKQRQLVEKVQAEIDNLSVEADGNGWRIKGLVYCVEIRCPQSGWMVPLIPSLVLSEDYRVVAQLVPCPKSKRYDIAIKQGVSVEELAEARKGTVRSDGKGQDSYMFHKVGGAEYRIKISTLRGDSRNQEGSTGNRLRFWDKSDFKPGPDDIFQERLYAILWARPKRKGRGEECEMRRVTEDDMLRERIVEEFVGKHLAEWQRKGWVPDMRIEPGAETTRLSRERGWTHWHHLFNPRQILIAAIVRKHLTGALGFGFAQVLNWNSRLSQWNGAKTRGYGNSAQTFYNQALNTFYNYACRGFSGCASLLLTNFSSFPIRNAAGRHLECCPARVISYSSDIFITDPPYGDAVNYEEILEFFIAWFRKNPPTEFAAWVWDSRRSLAIKGQAEDFRRGMVVAYQRMAECMPDNGIQVIMFTHQSGSIWADMANIVWASGLQVTAAWYVVTETDSPLRTGSYVKGTVLLVLRKCHGTYKTTRDDLAWEIQEEVEKQIRDLTGLNQEAKGLYRDENVFEDADIQMAGYAAALRVLTRYAIIDGRDMTAEAIRPRVKGETTFVDGLIAFAVDTANQCLVPQGIPERHWKEFTGAERFYLKLLDLEAKGLKTLDNYQNFAKAFKVRDFRALMGSQKANEARLRGAVEFGKNEMSEGSELHQSALRAVLYAVMELAKNLDGNDVVAHLTLNVPDYYSNQSQRERVVELADYLAKKLETLRPDEASAARVLRELVKNHRLG